MDKVTFTRKELYDLVWSESMVSLAKKYSISDTGLRKICRRLNIPVPKGGYWEKLKWGKPVNVEPFIVDNTVEQSISLSAKEVEIATASPLKIRQKEIEQDPNATLTVPAKLSNPDELVIKTRDYLSGKPHKDYNSGILNASWNELDIQVSPEFVTRALRFMDTLIKALKARGHRVYINHRKTYVEVYKEDYQIAFREMTTRVTVTERYTHTFMKGTGRLVFRAHVNYNDRFWEDKKLTLEEQLSSIIAKLEVSAEQKKIEREEYRKKREEREKKEQAEREIIRRKEKEIADFRALLEEAQTWQKINVLRSYLNEIESKIEENSSDSQTLLRWIESTRNNASKYDPIEGRMKQILSLEN